MPKYDDLEIEFEETTTGLKIKKAKDGREKDVMNDFKKPARLEVYDKHGKSVHMPDGTVVVTQLNPTCCWVRCADGWYVYCW